MSTDELKSKLDELIKSRNEKKVEPEIDWSKVIEEWKSRLDSLYADIETYLAEYKKEDKIKIQMTDICINESIGQYDTKEMFILIGGDVIELKPKGTNIIGSYGRVDVIYNHQLVCMFALLGKSINSTRDQIKITIGTEPNTVVDRSEDEKSQTKEPIVWKLVTYKYVHNRKTYDYKFLNKDTFLTTLFDILSSKE